MAGAKKLKARKEIIITGFGGQGIVLAGRILGQAASLGDNRQSTLVQSYGPEARGGACSADVIISDDTINYPNVRNPDILVCMSKSGFDKFIDRLPEDGILITDQDLVRTEQTRKFAYAIPATRMAEELGRKMMANIIMLGFFTAITGTVSDDSMRDTVIQSVPKGTEDKNTDAFNKGFDYGLALLKGQQKKAAGQREAR